MTTLEIVLIIALFFSPAITLFVLHIIVEKMSK